MSRKRPLKKFTRRVRPALGSLAIRILGRLPLLVNRGIGGFVGRISYGFGGRPVEISRDNVNRCFPDMDPAGQAALVRSSLVHTAMTALEAPSIWIQAPEKLRCYVVGVDGFARVEQQQTSGRGLLLLAPHLGNWEIMGPWLPPRLKHITFMYQPSGMDAIDDLMLRGRGRAGIKLAPASRKGVSQVLKALQAGEVVAILPDQVPDEGAGRAAHFFGQPAQTMTLIHKLVQRTDCDVLMIFAKRVTDGYEVVVREADRAIKDREMASSLNALNRSVEACVREIPEQYQWEYKRFKHVVSAAKTSG
ncbi:MAG: lysophospholipid acyltransferase family protein [Cellvibrionaceae bacterium]